MATGQAGLRTFRSGTQSQGAPQGPVQPIVATLTADNQFVNVSGFTLLQLYSDNTTATNRTFTIPNGDFVGHRLTMVLESGASSTCQLINTGNCALVGDWTPLQYQAITVYWDGSFWIEVGRSNPSTATSALTSAHLFVGNASNVATDTAITGDVTIDNAGVTTIGTNKVISATINSLAVTTAKINTAAVTVVKLDPAVLVDLNVALTQAQILTLHSVPVTLLAAPGAGIAYLIDEIEQLHTYSTAVYTGGGDLTVTYGAAGDAIIDMDSTFVTAGSSFNGLSRPTIYNLDNSTGTAKAGYDLSGASNKALVLQAAVADFGAGNAGNIIKFRIRYHQVTLLT